MIVSVNQCESHSRYTQIRIFEDRPTQLHTNQRSRKRANEMQEHQALQVNSQPYSHYKSAEFSRHMHSTDLVHLEI